MFSEGLRFGRDAARAKVEVPHGPAALLSSPQKAADSRHVLLRSFESEEKPTFVPVLDSYASRADYYNTMMRNVVAEALSAFQASTAQTTLKAVWRRGCLVVSAPEAASELKGHLGATAARPGTDGAQRAAEAAAELQLKDNVVELDGKLYWVSGCEAEPDQAEPGSTVQEATLEGFALDGAELQQPQESFSLRGSRTLRVRLFAGDYANRYRCAEELLRGSALEPQLEAAVLDPAKVVAGTYPSPTGRPAFRSDLMKINEEQQKAISGLSRRLEVIHGPPGTGKSTTIFHLLSTCMPRNSMAVVTCVTNQAVDAVAEKLAKTHESDVGPFMLVLGNPKRVGRTAGRYTMENLCKRDALVVSMAWAVGRLQRTAAALEMLQQARAARLFRPHTRSRLTGAVLLEQPAVRARIQALATKTPFASTQKKMAWAQESHLETINRVKEAMARVVVRTRLLVLPLKSGHKQFAYWSPISQRPRTWDVNQFQERVLAALRRAQEAHRVAIQTAPARNMRRTNVLLCTVPSSYKVAHLKEEFPEEFPARLFVGVLDEAAATAETYVPFLISLGIENLVLLGDHKQLSPLVMALGGDRELQGTNVDRSLMERAVQRGARVHPLRVQYRMPPVLCQLVSRLFYDGQLRSDAGADELERRMRAMGLANKMPPSVLRWFDVAWEEDVVGTSKVNCAEVVKIVDLLSTDPVLSRSRDRIMVITFYKPQAALLQHATATLAGQSAVDVVTVDAAQGSEAPHVVLSAVRSNRARNIGFVRDPRRLNVAISRAQQTLTIVGDGHTMRSDGNWSQVLEGFRSGGQHVTVDLDLLQRHAQWERVGEKAEGMAAARSKGLKGGGRGAAGPNGKGGLAGGPSSGLASLGYAPERRSTTRADCVYFLQGRCNKGAHCSFAHTSAEKVEREVCSFWRRGRCQRGTACSFRHADS